MTRRAYVTEATPGKYTRYRCPTCPIRRSSCYTPPWSRCKFFGSLYVNPTVTPQIGVHCNFAQAREEDTLTLECHNCASKRDWKITMLFEESEYRGIYHATGFEIECGACGTVEYIKAVPKENFFVRHLGEEE